MNFSKEIGTHLASVISEMVNEDEKPKSGGPGTYNVHNKSGEYVMWHRNFKDAKYHAEKIGGTHKKVPAEAKPKADHSGATIRMPDGSFKPMTKANVKITTDHHWKQS